MGSRAKLLNLVTHDLGQAERLSQQLIFLHRGRPVESGPTDQVMHQPLNEITRLFLNRELVL